LEGDFKNLFTPLQIGNTTIPNRIFMSAGQTNFFIGIDAPNERALSFWEERAAGGVGLIITGQHHPFPLTTSAPPTAYESDDIIPSLRLVADTIHRHGTKCFGQLNHPGTILPGRFFGGGSTWSVFPSVFRKAHLNPAFQEPGHGMCVDDIKRAVKGYAEAALRFKKAGYDGVEIRSVVGLFLAQFLSGAMNIRTDDYGGILENRMRFLLETVDAVRKSVGQDFVVGVRFTGDEFLEWSGWSKEVGNTLEQGKEIAKRLEATGELDYLFPCGGTIYPPHVPSMYFPLGAFAYLPAEIKKVVSLPVFSTGRINDPALAEEIIAGNQADMVGMFRGLVADPEFPKKAREGKEEEIRRCIGCCEGCAPHIGMNLPLSCTVNVRAGREKEFVIKSAENKKRVLVVGGGGAGLEAARIAALRGHHVSLYEKEDTICKDLTIAVKAPGRDGWEDVLRYYSQQIKSLKVDLHLNTDVTPEMAEELIHSEGYDALVVATGATPFIPEVPGMESSELIIAEARDVLEGKTEVGEDVLIVAYENHSVALTTADFLVNKDKKVEVITESLFAGASLDISSAETIYTRLLASGVAITTLTGLKEIQGATLILINVLTGAERRIEKADTVIIAADGRPNDAFYYSLQGKVKEIYMAGQCVSPRRLLDSIFDGARVGQSL